jgi:hypothetical protein
VNQKIKSLHLRPGSGLRHRPMLERGPQVDALVCGWAERVRQRGGGDDEPSGFIWAQRGMSRKTLTSRTASVDFSRVGISLTITRLAHVPRGARPLRLTRCSWTLSPASHLAPPPHEEHMRWKRGERVRVKPAQYQSKSIWP